MKSIPVLLAACLLLAVPALAENDHEAIEQLIVSERLYRVSHRYKEHAECFAEDSLISTSWQSGGRSSFVGHSAAEAAEQSFNVNRCGGALIHQNGTRAFVEYPSTTVRTVTVNGEEAVLTSYMRLLYRVEKRASAWKIVELSTLGEADQLQPVIPGTDLHIDPAEVKRLRVSHRWLAYVRKRSGIDFSDDMPGTDRPEDVARLYDAAFAWLNGKEGE
ncbi:MAG: nuclear transport factor 2 family protein [Pyramidobacter sp.]|nr:nuclear transport factor 2 family protein [Pyramidobacter sp.]